jgi:hypothetical protein
MILAERRKELIEMEVMQRQAAAGTETSKRWNQKLLICRRPDGSKLGLTVKRSRSGWAA